MPGGPCTVTLPIDGYFSCHTHFESAERQIAAQQITISRLTNRHFDFYIHFESTKRQIPDGPGKQSLPQMCGKTDARWTVRHITTDNQGF